MSGVRPVPVLRHQATGVPLPWWDCRPVPLQTLLDYLGADRGAWPGLVSSGLLAAAGCVVERGQTRPISYYVPALIWAHHGWTPNTEALQILVAGDAALRQQIAATEALLAELRSVAAGDLRTARRVRAPLSIPFPVPALQR